MLAPIPEQKRALRTQAIARRDRLDAGFRADAAWRIADSDLPVNVARGAVVSGWVAMGSELDPLPLMQKLHGAGARLALPVIADKRLVFRAWSPGEPLVAAGFGTSEPPPEAELVEPDIVLVPLLAFDRTGYRLGYGKAYYDGALARLRARKPIVAIGLSFDVQCVDKVPAESHDQKLDYVITEAGVRFAAGDR